MPRERRGNLGSIVIFTLGWPVRLHDKVVINFRLRLSYSRQILAALTDRGLQASPKLTEVHILRVLLEQVSPLGQNKIQFGGSGRCV